MAIPKKDLDELLHANVITPQTVWDIEQYYLTKKQQQANPLLAIFAALGGILVGLGIILIFAHNWDNFSRQVKTILAFTPLLLSQAFAAYCIIKNKSVAFKETAAVLVFFSVGASISLVAQIYNISGDFPKFLLTWALLCAPVMYLLRSNAVVVLHLIMAVVYVVNKSLWKYPYEEPYWYLALIAIVLPYYYSLIKNDPEGRMTRVLHVLMPTSFIIAATTFFSHTGNFSLLLFMVFFGLLYLLGKLPQLSRVYTFVGITGLSVIMFVGSFRDMWNLFMNKISAGYIVVFVLMILGIVFMIFRNLKKKDTDPVQFLSVTLLLVYVLSVLSPAFAAVVTNLLALATGLWYIRKGIHKLNYPLVNFGLIIITILAGCRFFDTDLSFVVRGLLFVGVGAGFFVANYTVSKRKQQTLKPQPHEN
ncbi:DUF2157 domain-containing protein [Flavobacterium sp. RHBU_3]|uniref:DUF2157 domain-containing protein n=1 Tax=Flavobacterium sp. RHBU_3 TaxID=3391184 RepID=UPI003984CD35